MCEAQRILSSLVLNINCKIYINQRSGEILFTARKLFTD